MAVASPYVLVLYYSRHGATAKMAELIASGIESASNMEARLRTVPAVPPDTTASQPPVPEAGAVYCTEDDRQSDPVWQHGSCDETLLGLHRILVGHWCLNR